MVEKSIPAILINFENQTANVKVNSSKENMKSSRHACKEVVKVCQKAKKNSGVIALDYV